MSKKNEEQNAVENGNNSFYKNKFLKVFTDSPGKPLNIKQVISRAGLKKIIENNFAFSIIDQLLEDGAVELFENNKYRLAQKYQIHSGIIDLTRDGGGYVPVEGFKEDIYIPPGKTQKALPGDLVKVKIKEHHAARTGRINGEVEEIIERSSKPFVATVSIHNNRTFLHPDSHNIPLDFYCPLSGTKGAMNGQKVLATPVTWKGELPEAEIVRIIGNAGEHQTEMHAILLQYGFQTAFPESVEKAAAECPKEISKQDLAERKDFRQVLTFTIDPFDAKDFDDAISFLEIEPDIFEVGVHIADVTHYVKPGNILDQEAFLRATSVYLVDRTVPMLPEILSNNLCSLKPNEDKLCFSAVFKMDRNGKVLDEWFGRTIIHSDRRFTYEEVQEILDKEEGELFEELKTLNDIAHKLRKERFAQGSISFETEEVKFKLDDKGKPVEVILKVRKDAHKLIEDFMLLANRKVAAFVAGIRKKPTLPFVYRIHDLPDNEKLEKLKVFVKQFGYNLDVSNQHKTADSLNELMLSVEGKTEQNVVQSVAVRAMAKAIYTTDNLGHYGLGFKFYTHFTSPIRRYPDMMVHRLLNQYLNKDYNSDIQSLEKQCKHSSDMERKAAEAERASVKYKQVEYLTERIGKIFQGLVSGVTGWGIYVEIEEGKCEGMIRFNDLPGYYELDEANYQVIERRTGKRYRLGDKLFVKVKKTDMVKRTVDLIPVN